MLFYCFFFSSTKFFDLKIIKRRRRGTVSDSAVDDSDDSDCEPLTIQDVVTMLRHPELGLEIRDRQYHLVRNNFLFFFKKKK